MSNQCEYSITITNDKDVDERAGFDGMVEIDGHLMHCVTGARADFKANAPPKVTIWIDRATLDLHIKGHITLPEKEIELLRDFLAACDED